MDMTTAKRTTWPAKTRAADAARATEVRVADGPSFRRVVATPRKTILSAMDAADDWGVDVVVTTDRDDVESDEMDRDLMDSGLTILDAVARVLGGGCGDLSLSVTVASDEARRTVSVSALHIAVVPCTPAG